MPSRDPLRRLRAIREEERRVRGLQRERDRLIRRARREGHPWGRIAVAAGLSHRYVRQIVRDMRSLTSGD